MDERKAFLDAILADPASDLLRLAFADWLEEAGELPHAEFIRREVKLGGLIGWEDRFFDLTARPPSYRPELPYLPEGLSWNGPAYRRGFPAAVIAVDAEAYVRGAEELARLAPVEVLELDVAARAGLAVATGMLGDSPAMARLREVAVTLPGWNVAVLGHLLGSPHARNLEALSVSGCDLRGRNVRAAWAAADRFQPLRRLRLDFTRHGRALRYKSIDAFWGPEDGPCRLEELSLVASGPTAEDLRSVAESPAGETLTALHLGQNTLDLDDVVALTCSPGFAGLRLLRLDSCARVRAAEVRSLAESEYLGGLRVLDLGGNQVGSVAAGDLARPGAFPELRSLRLWGNPLGDAGAEALAGADWLGCVRELDLSSCGLTDRGVRWLLACPGLGRLVSLNLTGNGLSPETRSALRDRFGQAAMLDGPQR